MATLSTTSSSLKFPSPLIITSFSDRPFWNLLLPPPPPLSFNKLSVSSSDVCAPQEPLIAIHKYALLVRQAFSDDELCAAARLRVRCFNQFKQDLLGIEDHKRYLAEREFEALQERVAGKREGFRRVSCINASIPLSHLSSSPADLTACKFTNDGRDRVVVGSLDLSQCMRLPDEIIGMKPQAIGVDLARAYVSNVCVAKELHRNGLGYALISKAKLVAEEWGITDLYVHVAVDNEAAKQLYLKSGFTVESDEPVWQARFLNRPRRVLLWLGLPDPNKS